MCISTSCSEWCQVIHGDYNPMLAQDPADFLSVDVARVGDLDADDMAINSGIQQQSVAEILGGGGGRGCAAVDVGRKGLTMPKTDLEKGGHGEAGE